MSMRQAIKLMGLKEKVKQEICYYPKALWLLATQGGYTKLNKKQLLTLILKYSFSSFPY